MFLGFINEATNVILEQVKGVCMIAQRLISKEVYNGCLYGIFI